MKTCQKHSLPLLQKLLSLTKKCRIVSISRSGTSARASKEVPKLFFHVIFSSLPRNVVKSLVSMSSFCLIKQQLQPLKANQPKLDSRISNWILIVWKQESDQFMVWHHFSITAQWSCYYFPNLYKQFLCKKAITAWQSKSANIELKNC